MGQEERHHLERFIFLQHVFLRSFVWQPCLRYQRKQLDFLLTFNVKFEIDEELVVFEVFELEEVNVVLLLLVDLAVAVVTHDALVQARRRLCI